MTDIDAIIDRMNASDTIIRLFVNTDERNWEAVADCFAPKVFFDMSSMTGGKAVRVTSKKIIGQWETQLQGLDAIHHQVGNLLVKTEQAEAEAFCYATATHFFQNPTGNNTRTFVGTYDLHLVKGDDGSWKVDAFRFNLKFSEGNQELSEAANGRRTARSGAKG